MASGTGVLIYNQVINFRHEKAWQKLWLVIGTQGGSTIIDTVVQVIVNTVDFGLNVADATHQPRIYKDRAARSTLNPISTPTLSPHSKRKATAS